MNDERTDAIAREAARLLEAGRAAAIGEAIRVAAGMLGYRNAELPGHGRVRKHARAMSMQALGDVGYAEKVREVLRAAERLMTVLVEALPDAEPLLVGRAALGQIDGGVRVHVRLHTDAALAELAALLVEYGYDEPGFETVKSRVGRLNRLLLEDEGIEIALTRCPRSLAGSAAQDLFTGKRIATATLGQLRDRLGGTGGTDDGAAQRRSRGC